MVACASADEVTGDSPAFDSSTTIAAASDLTSARVLDAVSGLGLL